jgi:uncharacterized protein YidB (DUF937 family)
MALLPREQLADMLSRSILSSNAADFMALIDELISGVINSVAGDKAQALNDFFKTNGGLAGLAQKFQNGGANDLFASWVGTGENSLINPDQIEKILGSGPIHDLAVKLGIDTQQASDYIAAKLPELVDRLTPDAKIEPDAGAKPLPPAPTAA